MSAYPVISLSSSDGVVMARATLEPGTPIAEGLTTSERIPPGHKVAIRPHAAGEAVSKFGQIIGFVTQPIAPGQHVHVHNLSMGDFARDYAYGVDAKPTGMVEEPASFDGIHRPDG